MFSNHQGNAMPHTTAQSWTQGLRLDDEQRQGAWLKQLQGHPSDKGRAWAGPGGFSPAGVPALRDMATQCRHLLTRGLSQVWPLPVPLRRAGKLLLLGTVTTAAMASTLVVQGAMGRNPEEWQAALGRTQMVAVRTASGLLLGGVARDSSVSAEDLVKRGFIDDPAALAKVPPTLKAMLIALEDRHHGSWREICGISPLSLPTAALSGRGGSTLAMQVVKDVERAGGEGGWVLVQRKFREIGAAMRLGCTLGPDGVLNAYLARAPMVDYGGTTRGVLGAADAVFGVAPEDLSLAQQAVLAASVLAQITDASRLSPAIRSGGCAVVSAEKAQAEQVSLALALAWRHCRLLARAERALRLTTPDGPALQGALSDIKAMERGISFVNPWAPISTGRAANLSARAQALLPGAALAELRDHIDNSSSHSMPTASVVVALTDDHARFVQVAVPQALRKIEQADAQVLCSRLLAQDETAVLRCANTPAVPRAEVTLMRADVESGEIDRAFNIYPGALDRTLAGGSLAKWVVAQAAARAGRNAIDPLCPRQAREGGRWLRRVTRPVNGFAHCTDAQTITLRQAMGHSDSLATYELAKSLGPQRLAQALADLGLPPESPAGGGLAYQLSFGTYAATPRQWLEAGRRLASAAYGWPMHQPGLRFVRASAKSQPRTGLGLTAAQAHTLRALLEAPVQDPGATLTWADDWARAGKSGTTSSTVGPRGGRPYAAAKLSLLIQRDERRVLLSVIGQPNPPFALGSHSLQGGVFAPLVQALATPVAPPPPAQSLFAQTSPTTPLE